MLILADVVQAVRGVCKVQNMSAASAAACAAVTKMPR